MKKLIGLVLVGLMFFGCGGGTTGGTDATVIDLATEAPNISDKNATTLSNSERVASIKFANSGGTIASCTVTPSLPTGLTLGTDCSISGTPTVNQSLMTYTVTGTNRIGSDIALIDIEVIPSVTRTVTLSGTVTYDSVPFGAGNIGLDYNNITQKKVRGALVEVLNSVDAVLGTTTTDSNGSYSLSITGTTVKVRISAKLYKAVASGQSSWDFEVKDNTNSNALYAMEGSLLSLGNNATQTRNLNASSGWGGSSYTSTRVAAPFAILDVVYQAIQKITTAQSNAVFAPLNIFWSKNNVGVSGNKSLGEITTSHFDGTSLYILGKENSDTDEYDVAVVAHEWSHYFEANFSRSDSRGGIHGDGDMLDIRLAFGEGFATAFSSMIRDNQFYIDTLGTQQASSGGSDVEAGGSRTNPGWYSEASVYSILYDLYDATNDTGDTLTLGFTPIYNALIGSEKNTSAFTSIFSFITAIKTENPGNDTAIDAITSNESIAPITDIYGTGRSNRTQNSTPLYTSLSVGGGSVSITPNYTATAISASSRLGSYNFITFTISSAGTYTITASSGSGTNLDFYAYLEGSKSIAITSSTTGATISGTATLSVGTYRMQIVDNNLVSGQIFTVTLTKN